MLSRKDDLRQGGRRPLAMTGQSRQMLHNLHESLSHLRENAPNSPENGEGPQPLKPELSQSTPNLIDSKARDGYNKKALATIRNKLMPFQTDNPNVSIVSTSSQGSEDSTGTGHTEEVTQVSDTRWLPNSADLAILELVSLKVVYSDVEININFTTKVTGLYAAFNEKKCKSTSNSNFSIEIHCTCNLNLHVHLYDFQYKAKKL